jgi:hypothetical protein
MNVSFDETYISELYPRQSKNITLTIKVNTDKVGLYEILVNGTSKSPVYTDWGKLYLTVKEENKTELEKLIVFTEELLVENPECLELKEQLNEVKKEKEAGNFDKATVLANKVIDACKKAISQRKRATVFERPENKLLFWILVVIVASFLLTFVYYVIRKFRLRRTYVRESSPKPPNSEAY